MKKKNGPSKLAALDTELAQSEHLCDLLDAQQLRMQNLSKKHKGEFKAKISVEIVAVKENNG